MKPPPLLLAAALATTLAMPARADEIKVLASNGVRAALEELVPHFEHASGHKVSVSFGLAAALKRQIEAGEAFDLAVLTSAGIEDLAKQGRIDAASRTPIARSAVGIMVKSGAPRPDLSSPDALKRALLSARSVTWAKEGASGAYFATVVQKLGIAEELKPKLNLGSDGANAAEKVARGEAELGALLVNEIMAHHGVDVAGPLPAALQSYTVFHAGASAGSRHSAAAKSLADFLTKPDARAVFKAKGQEPG
jgi:molybdate transport system substrate-binding protein